VFGALADTRAETFLDNALADGAPFRVLRTVVIVPRDETQARDPTPNARRVILATDGRWR